MSVDTSKPPSVDPLNRSWDPANYFAKQIITKYLEGIKVTYPGKIEAYIPPGQPEPVPIDTASKAKPVLIGVPKEAPKVAIIGGGSGGLYAAFLLQEFGVPYEILEASDRLGGRLFTKRMGERPNDYYDAGAMRFPDTPIMKPLFNLFSRIDLPLGDYLFQDRNGDSTLYYNNVNKKRSDAPVSASAWGIKNVPDRYDALGWKVNVSNVVEPFAKQLIEDSKNHRHEGWELMMKYDKYSMKAYMAGNRSDNDPKLDELNLMPYPMDVVNWCETFDKSSGWYDRALSETVLEDLAFRWDGKPFDWKYIIGGSSNLLTRMDKYMAGRPGYIRPFFNSRVTGISCVSNIPGEAHPNIDSEDILEVQLSDGQSKHYSHVITTTTLPCLRTMDLRSARLDFQQKAALRMLQYSPSTKIGVRFRSRWWEDDKWMKKNGAYGAIFGGQSYTDNMSRVVVYPSYGLEKDEGAVLIVSYAWTNDALALSALMGTASEAALKCRILLDLMEIHRLESSALVELKDQWEAIDTQSWSNDPTTMGAFGVFGPGEFSSLYPALTCPAGGGRLHFAGEAVSVKHAWVIGALEASTRAVLEILLASYPDKVEEFKKEYGFPEFWTEELLKEQLVVGVSKMIPEDPPYQ